MITQSHLVSKQSKRFFSLALANEGLSLSPSITFTQSTQAKDFKKTRNARFKPVEQFPRYRNNEDFFVPFGLITPKDRYHFCKSSSKVGDGMFATVYKALDTQNKQSVAMKVINKKTCPKQVYKQEIRVMSQISAALGKSLVSDLPLGLATDMLETSEELRLVFPFKSGGDMLEDIMENQSLSENEARILMRRIVPVLSALHKSGFIHRDIKPENILLDAEESRDERMATAALSDYGYAKRVGEADKFQNPAGTFGYVAPEVLSNKIYTPSCDVWSLGTVLFTTIACYLPFPALEDGTELKQNASECIIERDLKAIKEGSKEISWEKEFSQEVFQGVSDDFKDLLRSMLEYDHTKRITIDEIMSHPWYTSDIEVNEPKVTSL